MESISLYYFFSTAAQSFAALLGITVTVYIFYRNTLSVEAQSLCDAMARIKTGKASAVHTGTRKEAIGDAEAFLEARNIIQTELNKLATALKRLKVINWQLHSLGSLLKYFVFTFCAIIYFILVVPFIDMLMRWWGIVLAFSVIIVFAVFYSIYQGFRVLTVAPGED